MMKPSPSFPPYPSLPIPSFPFLLTSPSPLSLKMSSHSGYYLSVVGLRLWYSSSQGAEPHAGGTQPVALSPWRPMVGALVCWALRVFNTGTASHTHKHTNTRTYTHTHTTTTTTTTTTTLLEQDSVPIIIFYTHLISRRCSAGQFDRSRCCCPPHPVSVLPGLLGADACCRGTSLARM